MTGANFNPRAPRGARPLHKALHLESKTFQSTCPARGTTRMHHKNFRGRVISIHVPREGHDALAEFSGGAMVISIHVPREGHDPAYHRLGDGHDAFQSTCPARGTTPFPPCYTGGEKDFNPRAPRGARLAHLSEQAVYKDISIHVPREGHDHSFSINSFNRFNFNPRAPRGARQ